MGFRIASHHPVYRPPRIVAIAGALLLAITAALLLDTTNASAAASSSSGGGGGSGQDLLGLGLSVGGLVRSLLFLGIGLMLGLKAAHHLKDDAHGRLVGLLLAGVVCVLLALPAGFNLIKNTATKLTSHGGYAQSSQGSISGGGASGP